MHGAVINEEELKNDILVIESYEVDEQKVFSNMTQSLENCLLWYQSNSKTKLKEICSNLDMNLQTIHNNRQQYVEVLRNTIVHYHEMEEKVIKAMEREKNGG